MQVVLYVDGGAEDVVLAAVPPVVDDNPVEGALLGVDGDLGADAALAAGAAEGRLDVSVEAPMQRRSGHSCGYGGVAGPVAYEHPLIVEVQLDLVEIDDAGAVPRLTDLDHVAAKDGISWGE